MVTVGTAAVVVLLSKGKAGPALVALWRRGPGSLSPLAFVALAASVFAVGSLLFTHLVFASNPRNVDGFAQLFQ